jgi:hypothetical protein
MITKEPCRNLHGHDIETAYRFDVQSGTLDAMMVPEDGASDLGEAPNLRKAAFRGGPEASAGSWAS